MNGLNLFEENIIIFLQEHSNELIYSILKFTADFGDELILLGVIGFFYWCYDKKVGIKLILNLSIANIFYPMLKNVFKRIRPYMNNQNVKCIKPAYDGDISSISVQGYSFPSGHMVNCACVYGELHKSYKNKLLRIILVIIVILVALSRIILGVHYISDVLIGFLFGTLICYILDFILKKYDKKIIYLVITIIGSIGFLFCKSNDFYTGYGMTLGAMLADLFENKYVNFKGTNKPLECVIRIIGGMVVFFVLSIICKLPFSTEFLESKTTLAYLTRTIRYFVGVFVSIGVYPLCFKFIKFNK